MSDDREPVRADVHVEAGRDARGDGRSVAAPRITVQLLGLEPQHVRVVERRSGMDEPAVFVELGGDDCKMTLAGRPYPRQQLTAEIAHRLAQLEEVHREKAGQ
jgi:hypothetical protein